MWLNPFFSTRLVWQFCQTHTFNNQIKMSKIFYSTFIATAFCILACKPNAKKEEKETAIPTTTTTTVKDSLAYLITSQSMGKVKLNMTKNEVLALYPQSKEDTINLELSMPALTIYDADNTKLFSAIYEENMVVGLITENAKMQTAAGIKVGSLYPALKENFKDLTFSNSEGLFASSTAANFLFFIDGEVLFKMKDDEITTEVEKISPEVRVTGIFIN
jgi:hypothetical protein